MLNRTLKYTLIALSILSTTGCNQRTIIIHPEDRTASRPTVPRVDPRKAPVVREEILINKNPNLGTAISVPENNPSLGTAIYSDEGNNTHDANVDAQMEREEAVARNTIMERMPFPVGEYSRLAKRGRSTVSGSIYLLNSHSSQKVMGKKVKLYLNPVTSYSEQWYQESYLGGYKLSKTDKRIYNYLKFTMSNSSGRYNFFGVPRGEYFLVGTIRCGEECGFNEPKTTRLVKRISVGSGVTKVEFMKNVP